MAGGPFWHGRRDRRVAARSASSHEGLRSRLMSASGGSRGVLYVIVCAAPAAANVDEFVRLALDAGWVVRVIATPMGERYLADLLADTREELTRVDSKAALLLAASGVIIGALLAGFFGGRWTPFDLSSKVQWLWWLGAASAAFGLFSIAAAVYPNIHQRRTV